MDKVKLQPKGPYKVGYCKPPESQRFGSKDRTAGSRKDNGAKRPSSLKEKLDEPLKIKIGGREMEMHPYQVALIRAAIEGLKGKPQSMRYFIDEMIKHNVLSDAMLTTRRVIQLDQSIPREVAHELLDNAGNPPWNDDDIDEVRDSRDWGVGIKWETLREVWRDE